jgi:hypothetical protein
MLDQLSFLSCPASREAMAKLIHRALRIPGVLEISLRPRSPDQAVYLGARMAHAGLKRLSDADLERRAGVLNHMLDALPDDACAIFLRGNATQYDPFGRELAGVLQRLPNHMVDDWFDISLKAIAAELRGDPEIPPSTLCVASAMHRAYGDMSQKAFSAMFAALGSPQHATNKKLCEAGRALYSRVLAVHPFDRAVVLRALINPAEGRAGASPRRATPRKR